LCSVTTKPAQRELGSERWLVSKRVNSSKADADDATLIERVELATAPGQQRFLCEFYLPLAVDPISSCQVLRSEKRNADAIGLCLIATRGNPKILKVDLL
jgi:hypothetical protein